MLVIIFWPFLPQMATVFSDGLYLIIYLSFLGDLKQRKLLIKQDFPFLELNVNKSVKRLPVRLMIVKNWFKI